MKHHGTRIAVITYHLFLLRRVDGCVALDAGRRGQSSGVSEPFFFVRRSFQLAYALREEQIPHSISDAL